MRSSKGIFVVGAKRTPFCKYGGPLKELPACQAFAAAAQEAMRSASIDPNYVDCTVVGNVNFLSQCDGGKTPRYCGIYSGVPLDKPALGISKSCGTGLQAVITSAVDIITGLSNISLTGGTEIMSSLPLLARNVRFGTALGTPYQLEDHVKRQFMDSYSGLTLQRIAEDLAKKYQITRNEVDEFALQSNLKWKSAHELKLFDSEIASLTVNIKKKEISIEMDQLDQPDVTLEDLNKLPAILDDGTIITTGNSSVPSDGAAAILLASEEAVTRHQLKPMARVTGWSCVGVEPLDTGIAAVPAVRRLLQNLELTLDDVDLFEINETFASHVLASAKELKVDLNKVNVNGGALTLGHPVAATGARMVTNIVYEMGRRNLKRAIAASSCGGGQGVAVMLERL